MEHALIATGLSKRYGTVQALRDGNIEIAAGEVMALVGENGAGKSTLVKILCGQVHPSGGQIRVDGKTVDLGSPKRAQRQGIAVVQQELSIVECLSVAENIVLGSPVARQFRSSNYLHRYARPYLDAVGLDYLESRTLAEELSVSERQLLEVARIAAQDPKVVMLDEPTASLADAEIARVRTAVLNLKKSGCGVLYITHRLGEVFELADRVTVMRDGVSQPPRTVLELSSSELIEAMLGRPLENMFPPRQSRTYGPNAIEFDALSTPGLRAALSGHVKKKEIVGFAGQVGSGASDVLRSLGGAEALLSGIVRCNGRAVRLGTPRRALRSGIAYCSGDRKLDGIFANRSVLENLTAPSLRSTATWGWIRRRSEYRRAAHLANLVGVAMPRLQASIRTLSGGNQQKVVLGKWLGTTPTVLLIEEPTRGVDVGARAEIYRSLRKFADDGLGIIFSSSDSLEVYGLADRLVTFFHGAAVGEHLPSEISHAELVREITHPNDREKTRLKVSQLKELSVVASDANRGDS